VNLSLTTPQGKQGLRMTTAQQIDEAQQAQVSVHDHGPGVLE
jgi:hypothetical protein